MSNPFQICRDNFGPAPRTFSRRERSYYFPKPPEWLNSAPLGRILKERDALLRVGHIVPATLVQANQALYHPGDSDLPALAIWSEDLELETDPVQLRLLARRLFHLKGKTVEGELSEIARHITSERSSPLKLPLPENFTAGRSVYLSDVFIFRRHLPFGYLTSPLLPLLAIPGQQSQVHVLPGRFWADELKDR